MSCRGRSGQSRRVLYSCALFGLETFCTVLYCIGSQVRSRIDQYRIVVSGQSSRVVSSRERTCRVLLGRGSSVKLFLVL
jgi:hypothetical protein